jgi:tetratricopeptide (TPR) repeat protein
MPRQPLRKRRKPVLRCIEPGSAAGTGATSAEASYRSPYTRDSFAGVPKVEIEDAEFEESRSVPTSSGRTSTPPPAYYDDDEDIPDLPGRAASPLRWLLLMVLVGGVALVVSQWERVAQMLGPDVEPEVIAADVGAGDTAVAEGHLAAYERAIEAYGRAAASGGDRDPRVLSKLSNAFSLAAQARLDDDADADVENLTSAAMAAAESAVRLDPQGIEARLALVDALRLAGASAEARERLEAVRAISFSRTAEFFRIDARLRAAEADGRLESGLRSARLAAELEPDQARYLLLAARAELAADNPQRTKALLEHVLAIRPGHPDATALMAAMAASEPEPEIDTESEAEGATAAEATATETPVVEGAETEISETATEAATESPTEAAQEAPEPARPSEPVESKTAEQPPPAPSPKRASKAEPTRQTPRYDEYDELARAARDDAFVDGRPPLADYESTMARGRQELAAGNYARARAYFDTALEVHPGSADAMDALGDVATAVRDYTSALRYYRVAAQRGKPDGYFKLGVTYERLGKTEEAVSAYYTYVKRYPNGSRAAEARRAIKTLEPRAELPPEPGTEPAR